MLKENLVEFIERSIKSNWEIEALADYKGGAYSYHEVAEKIARIHIVLEKSGFYLILFFWQKITTFIYEPIYSS